MTPDQGVHNVDRPRHARRALVWPFAGLLVMAGVQVWLGPSGVHAAAALKVAVRPAVPGEAWPMPVPADWPASPVRWESGQSAWAEYVRADTGVGASAWVIRTGLPLRSAQGGMWFAGMGSVPSSTSPFGLSGGTLLQVRELPLIGGGATFPTQVLWPGMVFNLLLGASAGWSVGAALSWALARRRERRGGCPVCGYPRAGLGPGGRCPECGSDQPPRGAEVWTAR